MIHRWSFIQQGSVATKKANQNGTLNSESVGGLGADILRYDIRNLNMSLMKAVWDVGGSLLAEGTTTNHPMMMLPESRTSILLNKTSSTCSSLAWRTTQVSTLWSLRSHWWGKLISSVKIWLEDSTTVGKWGWKAAAAGLANQASDKQDSAWSL